ncbi:hypothetical protein KSP39_PZI021270 [Platanthera zijinensis]|uniref:Integrase catalytic domain-containing protein n=1 Tax=Platanthera zijinensis TaxID=2320716 RepID=A0AAP0FWJ0_9ASPA
MPRSKAENDGIWVIIDRLTKSAHFIPIKQSGPTEKLVELYINAIVRLHGIPRTIASDRDGRFTSDLWRRVHNRLGTRLLFSTAFHPQTDGQSERTIQMLEDLLRMVVLDLKGSWEKYLSLAEFAYNNSYQATIQMAPFEALYGRRCRTSLSWAEDGETKLFPQKRIEKIEEKVCIIHQRMKIAQDRQQKYYNVRHRLMEFAVGDQVCLKIKPFKGISRLRRIGKLSPRYVGPFLVIERIGEVAYRLALPVELQRLHDVFHVSALRRYIPNPELMISASDVQIEADLSSPTTPYQIVDRQSKNLRNRQVNFVKGRFLFVVTGATGYAVTSQAFLNKSRRLPASVGRDFDGREPQKPIPSLALPGSVLGVLCSSLPFVSKSFCMASKTLHLNCYRIDESPKTLTQHVVDLQMSGGADRATMIVVGIDRIGWPTSLPTNEKEAFMKSVLREKKKALEDFAKSSNFNLRPGVENFVDEAIKEGLPLVLLTAYSKNGEEVCRSVIEKLGHERTVKVKIIGKEEVQQSFYGQLIFGKGVSSSLDEQLAKEARKAVSMEKQRVAEEVASILKLTVDIDTSSTESIDLIVATLRAAAECVGLTVQDCVLIAGSQSGVIGAEKIGMPSVVIRGGSTARAEFRSAKAVMDGFGGADLTVSKLLGKRFTNTS